MHATKRQAELGRDLHQGALIPAGRFADHGAAALRPGSGQSFGDGGDHVGIRTARPASSALSSPSSETSTPMHNGPATAERSVEADRRRATMAHLSQEGEGPLAQDCNSGWARPTVRAQDRKRQDDGSRLLANSCSTKNRSRRPPRHSYRRRKAAKEQRLNTYNPGVVGALYALLDRRVASLLATTIPSEHPARQRC